MDYITSFFQNVKDKLTSPFFATLILTLLFHHWQLWYACFNFDKGYSLGEKMVLINALAEHELTAGKIAFDLLFAVGATLFSYLVLIGTKSLSLYIDYGLMTKITELIVDKKVVLKETHDKVVVERDEYSEKYEEARKNIRELSRDFDKEFAQSRQKDELLLQQNESVNLLNKNISELNTQITAEKEKALQYERNLQKANGDVKTVKVLYDQMLESKESALYDSSQLKDMFFNDLNVNWWNAVNKFPPTIIKKARELRTDQKWQLFIEYAQVIKKGGKINSSVITDMVNYGLARRIESGSELTALGEVVWKFHLILGQII